MIRFRSMRSLYAASVRRPGHHLAGLALVLTLAACSSSAGDSAGDPDTTEADVADSNTVTDSGEAGASTTVTVAEPAETTVPPTIPDLAGRCATPGDVQAVVDGWAGANGVIGAIGSIHVDGELAALASVGVDDIDTQDPLAETAQMRIGGLTQVFTAALTLRLVDDGVIALDDRVATYLPGAPAELTVEHLLAHESGIRDGDVTSVLTQAILDPESTEQPPVAAARIVTEPLASAPGEEQVFANANYVVLDQVIEQATGDPYETVLTSMILEPLALTSTGFVDSPDMASPHEEADPSLPRLSLAGFDTQTVVRASGASGALVSSNTDVAAFLDALFAGSVISSESLGLMLDTTSPPRDGGGLGIDSTTADDGTTRYGLGGRTVGFAASASVDPAAGRVVVVLSNDGIAPVDDLAELLVTSELC
jgi:D-alanyl-D-alanine carboxypeptidase